MATNEWEFQGQILGWLNEEIASRGGLNLDLATQEPSQKSGKRSDLVVWRNRLAEVAFLTFELKTPSTEISDPQLLHDAISKARRWGASYFAIWNMSGAELYRVDGGGAPGGPAVLVRAWPPDPSIRKVSDWLQAEALASLKIRSRQILDAAHLASQNKVTGLQLESSVFVERVSSRVSELKEIFRPALAQALQLDASKRKRVSALAASQGMLGFVTDVDAAVAGQFAYRIAGQVLFYFALRRRQALLPPLSPDADRPLLDALRPFWDKVRRFDYEALFQPGELESLVPISPSAEDLVRRMIKEFSEYDWGSLSDDVLGSIFQSLIPKEEQALLGEFYTPPRVADLAIAFTVRSTQDDVLDPGCGSGTFLMRTYERMVATSTTTHQEALSRIWGFDISSFATELAAINLFRQDMSSFNNFPRIVPGDYFDRRPGELISFPPPQLGGVDKIEIAIPRFAAVVGNPPYLRSQNQDDLDPKYRQKLFNASAKNGVVAGPKTDLFLFFVYKSLEMLRPGGRLGFVVSSSWLTADLEWGSRRT